ncbi:MAG: hypothetical protein M3Y91_15440 [Actinomycetota bacterium]|nr:hypothetical protein [Actinomycetota bacterium]
MTSPLSPTAANPAITKPTLVAGGSGLALITLGVITGLLTHQTIDPSSITEIITGGATLIGANIGHVLSGNAALRHDAAKVASKLPELERALPVAEQAGRDLKTLAETVVPGVAKTAEDRAAALEARVDELVATANTHGVTTEAVRQALAEITAGTSVTKAVTAAAVAVDAAPAPVAGPVAGVGGLTIPATATV